MNARFEELDFSPTPIGEVSLRRRTDPVTHADIYEVKLDDEWLMSSMFTVAEIELARLGLARLDGDDLTVVVGGLGLGYTAQAVLEEPRVGELVVIELLEPVIRWHQQGLVPVGPVLTGDARCTLAQGDFFAMTVGEGYDAAQPARQFDAVLLDIDHSPSHVLDDRSLGFYLEAGTRSLASHIVSGGVFGLWSNDPPDQRYIDTLATAFVDVAAEVITFHNPLQGRNATATVYLATKG